MHKEKYLYFFRYDDTENNLCKLESRYVFGEEEKNKLLFSDVKVEPSCSAFIRRRLDIISCSEDFPTMIEEIKQKKIRTDGFKVEYIVLEGDETSYPDRLDKLKDVGYSIDTFPDYHNPSIVYVICFWEGVWYFGVSIKDEYTWFEHKKKPRSFSNSIGINIAKALVNIAAKSNKDSKLLDACCGVGTIMLEACFAGYNIEGCEISWKICRNAKENLAHFNYEAMVHYADVKDLSKRYDAAILDLPYNLYSAATDTDVFNIIVSAAKITDRLVIVSTTDITSWINDVGFIVSDYCSVNKRGKSSFARKIWVCEKNET